MAEDDVPELSPAEVAAAKAEFLGNPPEILDPNEPAAPVVDDESAAIDELITPPAGEPGSAPQGITPPGPIADRFVVGHDQFGNEIQVSREQAYEAWQVQQALRTPDGIRTLVANGLQALGYDVLAVREALDAYDDGQQPEAPADPFASLEDDEPITVAQARALAAQAADQAAQRAAAQVADPLAQVQQAIEQQQAAAVRSVTDAAVVEVLGPVPYDDPVKLEAYKIQVSAIVDRGQQYYDPEQWANPDHIKQAVQTAAAQINAENEARFQAFLQSKRTTAKSQPPNISGGAGSDGPMPEPKTMAEAKKQALASGFFE